MADGRVIEVLEDLSQLTLKAASEFAKRASDAVSARNAFAVALAGGSTPKSLYALLARDPRYRDRLPWNRTHFFWGDERHVPSDQAESNFQMAHQALLSTLRIPAGNVHRIRSELRIASEAASEYQAELRQFFRLREDEIPRFDLILLGMGVDGHTASLFPGSEAVRETSRLVTAPWVEKLNSFRITLTPPALNGAGCVCFLVSGAEKASALKAVLEGRTEIDRFPAQVIRPTNGILHWLVDRAAAGQLQCRPVSSSAEK